MVRLRFSRGIIAALIFCAAVTCTQAADQKSKPASKDIDTLRQAIEDQSKQIEALTQQIAKLTEALEAHGISTGATPAPSSSSAPSTSPSPESSPAMTGVAQPVDSQGTHTVTKGETLTSIAKHYKITVGDLEKVNKIENDRTLQIGQVLIIPPATAPSPSPEEKKENQ